MFKKLAVLFTVLTIVSMLLVPIAYAAAPQDFAYLDLSENKTWYAGEDATNVALKVYGVTSEGTKVDISNDIATPVSDNTKVFTVNGNKISSTGRKGKAIVTVTYTTATKGNLTAKLIFARQDSKAAANQPIQADVSGVEGLSDSYKTNGAAGTKVGGHLGLGAYGGFTNTWTFRLMRKSYATDNKTENAVNSPINYRWWDSGYRSAGIWFYDDGGESTSGLSKVLISDSALFHQDGNFADDYGYTPELKAKWEGMKGYVAFTDGLVRGNGTYYCALRYFVGGDGWAFPNIARTTGWHQVVFSLEKNPNAEYGWTVYGYLDGKSLFSKDIVPTTDPTNGATTDSNAWAAFEIRPMATTGYYSDSIMMASLETEDIGKTLTGDIGEGGTVTVNGDAFTNGATVKIDAGDPVNVVATPASGKEVATVLLGEKELTVDEDGNATGTMPATDATLKVLFKNIDSQGPQDFEYIDITENKTWYTGTDAKAVTITVKGVKADGTKVDITNDVATIESDNTKVFTVDADKKLSSTGRKGKATITVTYATATKGNLTAKLIFARQDAQTAANQPIQADVSGVEGLSDSYKTNGAAGTNVGGHLGLGAYGGFPNAWTFRLVRKSYVNGHAPENAVNTSINYRWWDSGYRSAGIWFYDDGISSNCGLSLVQITDSTLMHQAGNFADDYGYTPELKAKWADKKGYSAFASTGVLKGNADYYCALRYFVGGDGWAFSGIKRTAGWHQVVFSLEKNPEAEYGWSVYGYLDGKSLFVRDIVPDGNATQGSDSNSWAAFEIRPFDSTAYYSDSIMMASLETEDTSKTLTAAIGEGGSVTVNGSALANAATTKVEPGDDITVAITPDAGYDVDTVKLGDAVLTVNASNEVTAKMPADNTTLTVTFKAKSVAPSISSDDSNNYFKTIDGAATAFVYAKLGDFYNPALNAGYGMKLWIKGQPENVLTLAAMENDSTAAVATPNTAFAIKVFGDAITADNTYVFKPYVGDTEGAEVEVSFAE